MVRKVVANGPWRRSSSRGSVTFAYGSRLDERPTSAAHAGRSATLHSAHLKLIPTPLLPKTSRPAEFGSFCSRDG
eukprot:3240069-Prymnesium_polylepis.2